MIHPKPVTLEGYGMRLEPLTQSHRDDLAAAASDGRLWELWFTSVPEPDKRFFNFILTTAALRPDLLYSAF